jgi:hypothetical protein
VFFYAEMLALVALPEVFRLELLANLDLGLLRTGDLQRILQ